MCKKVLAMYDVRGIQNYIYRTPHIKDAMGASIIIEDIIVKIIRTRSSELFAIVFSWNPAWMHANARGKKYY